MEFHDRPLKNLGPDALSRYPGESGEVRALATVPTEVQDWSDKFEAGVVAATVGRTGVRVVSWALVRRTGMSEPEYSCLVHQIGSGGHVWDLSLSEYQ